MIKIHRQPLIVSHSVKGRLVRVYRIMGRNCLIGSSRQSNLRLMSEHVAGMTCMLEHGEAGWSLIDLGSQPDVKLDGKPFIEQVIDQKMVLEIGDHRLELRPTQKRRPTFREPVIGQGTKLAVVKWKGQVIETSLNPQDFEVYKKTPRADLEVSEIEIKYTDRVSKENTLFDPEMKKPILGTFITLFIFMAILLGLPMPKEENVKKPENVFTHMIYDSQVLAQKKKQLVSMGVHTPKGTGNGNGTISEGAKGTQSNATKAMASLRQAGVQSLISKIASRASQSAKMLAALAATPSANAAIDNGAGAFGNLPTGAAALGKTGIMGNGKGFKIGGIGTGGKGGGTGDYKNGAGLGTGATGNGEVGMEDTESVVEGGLDREVIASVIKEHLGQIRYCYERQLSANPDLYGKIKIRFTIDADGQVDSQAIGQSTLKSAMVEECILRRIASWKFPKPKGGTKVLVSYPFLFKSVN